MRKLKIVLSAFVVLLTSCQKKVSSSEKYGVADAEYLHRCEKKLTDIIVTDIFSPPVASRVYVYPLLASYEAAKYANPKAMSLTAQLKGFGEMPIPEKGAEYDFTVSAITAFCTTAKKVVFSTKDIDNFQTIALAELKERSNEETHKRSIEFGEKIAQTIIKRLSSDLYKETRGMERFEVTTNQPARWVPTLPDYADAVEPHWMKMKVMTLDTASQFRHPVPIAYSEDPKSEFWKQVTTVYETVKNITPEQDNIVTFWDDNPFVSRHKGHLMFQDKKMTPGGHWLAICRIVSRHQKADFVKTAQAYSLTSVALFEAFVSCWDEKYATTFVRPETVIVNRIEKNWQPYLVTPPFPSYTSGHSTISASAAEMLTSIYGDNIAFTDSTEKEYGLPIRSFKSFREAAKEASISRVYGGIHYPMDCEKGNEQGTKVGQWVVSKIKM
jgi:PAP2 superfamily